MIDTLDLLEKDCFSPEAKRQPLLPEGGESAVGHRISDSMKVRQLRRHEVMAPCVTVALAVEQLAKANRWDELPAAVAQLQFEAERLNRALPALMGNTS